MKYGVRVKKLFIFLLALLLTTGMMPAMSLTAEADTSGVTYYAPKRDAGSILFDENGNVLFQEETVSDYIAVTSDTKTWENGQWYVVDGEVTISSMVTVGNSANLILCDEAKLTVNGGICVGYNNTLNIYGQINNSGVLESSGENCSGIGSYGDTAGNITINGGIIYAFSKYAAGIGATDYNYGGIVTINGGYVEAAGGNGSAGIGGARYGKSRLLTINGGTVVAKGHHSGAGIGGGVNGAEGELVINGGNVTAIGGVVAPGIGPGNGYTGNEAGTLKVDPNVVVYGSTDNENWTILTDLSQRSLYRYIMARRIVPTVSVTAGENIIYYDNISEAAADWNSAGGGSVLTLLADIAAESTVEVSGGSAESPMVLDLNNYGILYTGTDNASVITVNENAYLTLKDSAGDSGTVRYIAKDSDGRATSVVESADQAGSNYTEVTGGYIAGGNGHNLLHTLWGGGIFNAGVTVIEGGTITGNTARAGGGLANFETLTMSGGTIKDNIAAMYAGGFMNIGIAEMTDGLIAENTGYYGGGVMNMGYGDEDEEVPYKDAEFTLRGGIIEKNTATQNGGGFWNMASEGEASFVMSGGSINNNTATYYSGGVISDGFAGSSVVMEGGEIRDNKSSYESGGLDIIDGTLTMSGSPVVSGNTFNGKACNVYLSNQKKINASSLTGGDVGVSMAAPGVFTEGASFESNSEAEAIFSSDDSSYFVTVNEENQAQLSNPPETYVAASGISGSFEDKIRMNFYYKLPDGVTLPDGAYVKITGSGSAGDVQTSFADAATTDANGNTVYKFSIPLAAKEASDTIAAAACTADGTPIPVTTSGGALKEDGIVSSNLMTYFTWMAENGSTDADMMLGSAAKDYCSAAQIYFGYNADGLAVSEEAKGVTLENLSRFAASQNGTLPDGVKLKGITAMLEADNTLRVYFKADEGVNPVCSIDGSPAELQTRTTDGSTYLALAAGKKSNELHVTNIYSIGEYEVTASVLSYARSCLKSSNENLQNLGRTLYLYNRAAIAKFGDPNE